MKRMRMALPGLPMGRGSVAVSSYVDDGNCLVLKEEEIVRVEGIFVNFERVSGALLNKNEKSKILGLGAWRGREEWPVKWLRPETSIKVLGIILTPSYKEILRLNWDKVVDKFRKCLLGWKTRALPSLEQRIFVLETYGLSKFWYVAAVLPLPARFLVEIQKLMGAFLWKGSLLRVAMDRMKLPKEKGGLGLVCVEMKARALFTHTGLRLLSIPGLSEIASYLFGQRLRKLWNTVSSIQLQPGPRVEYLPSYAQDLALVLEGSL